MLATPRRIGWVTETNETMKPNHILLLCSAIALPQLAMADLASTNPAGLGDVHALLAYCAKVDPANAGSFNAQWNSIVGGATGKQLDSVEDGGAYKKGYDSLLAVLEKLPKQEAAAICKDTAAKWNAGGSEPTGGPDKGGHDKDDGKSDR
jgi:hypothetical protein